MRQCRQIVALLIFFLFPFNVAAEDSVIPQPAIALHGTPKYGPGFKNFDYVNPDAAKGGTLRMSALGTFDSLNPFIVKGASADGLNGLVYETLMTQSQDEPFTKYGLLAESIEVPSDHSWVAFTLRPQAHWSDGRPVKAEDVVWSFNNLMASGSPFYKSYYGDVKSVEATGMYRVKFIIANPQNAELPLTLGELPILPKHFWEDQGRNISSTTLEPPVGSGPYLVGAVVPGHSIEYKRDPKWWGKNLAVNKGRWNFDRVTFDYYKDGDIAIEAFIAGQYDVREENIAKNWANSYDAPAVRDGRIVKEEIANETPQGMQAFIYNIRKPVFQDRAVREALAYAFDFEWENKQFAYNSYVRTRSYFSNSELESHNAPEGRELEILNKFKGRVPTEVFTTEYNPPATDGSGNNRPNLLKAKKILEDAGYEIEDDGVRKNKATGQRLEFEIVDYNPAFERWTLPFVQNLQRIGVRATYRVVDPAQYKNRIDNFDYDMTTDWFHQSNSPGNEQAEFWGSTRANAPGSRNSIGIQDPAVDELVAQLIHAATRDELVATSHALDRVLQYGYYVIPQWHLDKWRIAHWNTLERPGHLSPQSPGIVDTWWSKASETAATPVPAPKRH